MPYVEFTGLAIDSESSTMPESTATWQHVLSVSGPQDMAQQVLHAIVIEHRQESAMEPLYIQHKGLKEGQLARCFVPHGQQSILSRTIETHTMYNNSTCLIS